MPEEITLQGTVIESGTELPLTGHHVEAWDVQPTRFGRLGVGTSDPDGRFHIAVDKARFPDPAALPQVHWKVYRRRRLVFDSAAAGGASTLRDRQPQPVTLGDANADIRLVIPAREAANDRLSPEMLYDALAFYHESDFRGVMRDTGARARAFREFGAAALKRAASGAKLEPVRSPETTTANVVGVSTDMARSHLAEHRVEVAAVLPYEPQADRASLRVLTAMPLRLKAGDRVNLYEENGQIKYYALADRAEQPPPSSDDLANRVTDTQRTVTETRRTVERFEAEIRELREESARKDTVITELQATLAEARESDEEKGKALTDFKKALDKLRRDHEKLKERVG